MNTPAGEAQPIQVSCQRRMHLGSVAAESTRGCLRIRANLFHVILRRPNAPIRSESPQVSSVAPAPRLRRQSLGFSYPQQPHLTIQLFALMIPNIFDNPALCTHDPKPQPLPDFLDFSSASYCPPPAVLLALRPSSAPTTPPLKRCRYCAAAACCRSPARRWQKGELGERVSHLTMNIF